MVGCSFFAGPGNPCSLTFIFDSNVTKVTGLGYTWTTSGENKVFGIDDYDHEFYVTLQDGYTVDTVSGNITTGSVSYSSGDSFTIYPEEASGFDGTITITSKLGGGASTMSKSYDLSTSTKWANLADGSHIVKLKSKGSGYGTSSFSNSVTVTKGTQFETANISVSGTDSEPTIQNMDQSKVYTVQYKFEYVDDLFTLTYNASTSSWQRSLISGDNMSNIVSQTATSVTLFGGTGGATLTGGTIRSVFGLEATTKEIMDQLNVPFIACGAYNCIVSGTGITLADGSMKKIEDITFDDDLLVWDFYEGKFDSAKPLWISKERVASLYNLCQFDNGSAVGFVGETSKGFHRIYNDTAKSFTYTSTKTNVGDKTFTDKGTFTTLVSQEIVEQEVSYYNIGTEKHINLFANGILTSGSRIPNRYAIKDMMYYGERLISEEEEQMRINKAKRL